MINDGPARAARMTTDTRSFSPRKQLFIVIAMATAIALAYGIGAAVKAHAKAKEVSDESDEPPGMFRPTEEQWRALNIQEARPMSFRAALVTDGSIAFDDETTTPVFSPFTGRVTRLIAKPGDVVAAGAPLMAVEATEFVQGQNDLAVASAAFESARAQLAQAQLNERRQHDLYSVKAGALKDWTQSQTDLVAAQANLHSAQVAFDAARGKLRVLGRSGEEIERMEKAGPSDAVNPEAIVRAPIAGTVTVRQVGLGQYITSAANGAANPVFSIGDLSKVWLVANVREVDAPLMRVGRAVEVRVPAFPDRVFAARLTWVATSVDPATHRLPVRAEIDNRDGALKPMMFATFSIATGDASSGIGIPKSAVVYEGDEARVFVVAEGRLLQSRAVKVGRESPEMIEVVSGLAPGDKIVTAGAVFIDRATAGS
jgi:cobalt-zinc-cadmium efflux system membrane fusion protein